MVKRYKTEARAIRHVFALVHSCGVWPGILKRTDAKGKPYWVLTRELDPEPLGDPDD